MDTCSCCSSVKSEPEEVRLVDVTKAIRRLSIKRRSLSDKRIQAAYTAAISELENTKVLDAVEVVRYKDCKYWDKRNFKNNGICLQKKNPIFFMTAPNFYCACGERREGE